MGRPGKGIIMWNQRMWSRISLIMSMERSKTATPKSPKTTTSNSLTKNKNNQTNNTHTEYENQHHYSTLRPSTSIKNTTNKQIPSTPTLLTKAPHFNTPSRLSKSTSHKIAIRWFKSAQEESCHRCRWWNRLKFTSHPPSQATNDTLLFSREGRSRYLLRKWRQWKRRRFFGVGRR